MKIFKTCRILVLIAAAGSLLAGAETSVSGGMDDAQNLSAAMKRDPFWPVGYKPKKSVVVETKDQGVLAVIEEGTDWNKAMGQVSIQGISSRADSEYYAIINGQVKSTGETVTVQRGGVSYTWIIESISPPSSVKLRRMSAN